MCVSGDIQLDEDRVLEYCFNGCWSVFCQLTHSEATVACRQLGHVTYTHCQNSLVISTNRLVTSIAFQISITAQLRC